MTIGDLLFRLIADGSQLTPSVEKEAQKAGDAGAKTLGQRLSSGLKTNGVKAFGAVAAGAFALATKGALQLEEVQARFQAETGASAEETSRMASVINRSAAENQLSLDAVADAAARVHNDLGLTGDAAAEMTAKFSKFARVTRQDAGAAVSSFDDILDAWGLEAADSGRIMDQLVASHQKYGGSIEENQAALGKMAPQLLALNATVDDGIGLLNLFAASGIDASKSQAALNTAVKNLKPGQTLDDLIKDISSIEDPTKRAQRAIEVFGAKGGVALANALKPGVDSLEDFTVTAEESAGAVDKAADALDSTFAGRIRKAISIATGELREFGKAFGPLITSAGALGSLAATMFPDFGPALGRKILAGFKLPVAGLKKVGARVMSAIGVGIASSAAESAVSEAVGESVSGAVTKAGKGAAIKNAAMGLGTAAAGAIGAGLLAGLAVLAVGKMIADDLERQKAALSEQLSAFIEQASLDALVKARDGLKAQVDSMNFFGIEFQLFGERNGPNGLDAQLARLEAEIARRSPRVGDMLAEGVAQGVEAGAGKIETATGGAVGRSIRGARQKAGDIAQALGRVIPESIAAGVLEKQDEPVAAMDSLRNLMKNALSPAKRIARDIGILTSKELAKGLADSRPEVRAEAERVQAVAEKDLAELIQGGGDVGKKAASELAKKLRSKNPQVRASAERVRDIVNGKIDDIPAAAGTAGTNAGTVLMSNFRRAVNAAGVVTIQVRTSDTTKGGRATGGPVKAGDPWWVGERGPEIFVPDVNGRVLSHAESVKATASGHPLDAGGGDTIHVTVPVTGFLRAETPEDVARPLRAIAAAGVIRNPRRRRTVEVPSRV